MESDQQAERGQAEADDYPNHHWGQALQYLERAVQVSVEVSAGARYELS
jgi:hypothetical protein